MSPPGWQYLLCCCLLCSVHGTIPKPRNVRIDSVNLKSILLWDPPPLQEENVTYTVQHTIQQYNTLFRSFKDLCIKTNFTECNISDIPVYGTHILRVRAESEAGLSAWVNLTFEPLRDTIIGPPAVEAEETNGGLNIHVTGPNVTHCGTNWTIVDFYGISMIYNMQIWKKDNDEQVRNVKCEYPYSITLDDLDPMTTYCFKIQAFDYGMNKSGEWTEDYCSKTAGIGVDPVDPVWLIIIIPIVLVLFPFCCIMTLRVYRRVKYSYFPSYSLPQHFKEFLGMPSYGSEFWASLPHLDDRVCEKIIVVSEEQKNDDSD